jgi:cell volume regulation protein A
VLASLIVQGWTIAPVARWLQIEVPRTVKDTEFLQLTIKHEQDKALLIYPVLADSPAVGLSINRLPVTEGSQVMGLIRRGVLSENIHREKLSIDDQVVFLATSSAKENLARVFAKASSNASLEPKRFFGEFALQPDAKLLDIAKSYGFSIDQQAEDLTLEQYLLKQFYGKPVVGDQVKLGSVKFVIREIDGEHIIAVGLKLGSSKKKRK